MNAPEIEEIQRRAAANDADAQYALAAMMSALNNAEAARHWLHRAASQGHADALYTLAGAELTLTEGAVEHRAAAVAGLERAREKGSLAALRVLAALTAAGLIGEGGWPEAISMMREACARGEAPAMREIAALLFDLDANDADAAAMLATAAAADALAAALAKRREKRGRPAPGGIFSLDRAFEKLAREKQDPAPEEICANPRVKAFRGALGEDLCDHLIGAALPRLKREHVLGADGQRRIHPHRTAWGALLGFGFADFPAITAGKKMARLARVPYAHAEPLSILRYVPGQEYRPHFDFLGPNDPDLGAHGQRLKTALLYLNEDYVGGETHFLAPGVKYSGKTGDILVFHNVDDSGAIDYASRHEGRMIEKGEKWIGSLWLRDRPFSG